MAAAGASLAAILLVAVGMGTMLGPSALPKWDEPVTKYLGRLFDAGARVAEDTYVKLLVAIPGGAQATVGKADASEELGGLSSADTGKVDLESHKGLEQPVAKNSHQIDVQRQVSVERYAETQREMAAQEEPLVLPEQPDEIRERMPPVSPSGPEMRCGEAIPSESTLVTRGIELKCKSSYQGKQGRQHSWKYVITMKNTGQETVQMLTRHWLFVTSGGALETEMKGPGARGVTPVLPPGGSWSYESGTSLSTPFGSMHGSFQFEVLKGDRSPGKRSFSGRVARLLLASKKTAQKEVPCVGEASQGLLPLTSVLSTERVILGGHADSVGEKGGQYHFIYDVQFNNARDTEIEVLTHSWTVVGSDGSRSVVEEGNGVGGSYRTRPHRLGAGDAFRVQGRLISPTPDANAEGTFRVIIKSDEGRFEEIEARTDYMGLSTTKTHVPNFVAAPDALR